MDTWLYHFDAHLRQFFAIDHTDAGMDEQQLSRYRDLNPREAALTFGEDYDLTRADDPWSG